MLMRNTSDDFCCLRKMISYFEMIFKDAVKDTYFDVGVFFDVSIKKIKGLNCQIRSLNRNSFMR